MNDAERQDDTGAAAAEPDASGHSHESACLNCGASLAGDYCHDCGQKAHVHRTLGAFGHDLLHGVLHLEGKTWRTLPMLAWRPGELTRRYIEGERVRFVSPLALFLFSVFVMFITFSVLSGSMRIDPTGGTNFAESIRQAELTAERLERERAQRAASGQAVDELDQRIRQQREEVSLMRTMRERGLFQGATIRLSDEMPHWLHKAVDKINQNPSLVAYKLQSNAYKYSWALIPLSLPFLWLLMLHRRRYRRYGAYDHIVFITYSIAFTSLLLTLLSVLRAIGVPQVMLVLAFFLVPPVHMYRQLRGAYLLSRFGALWRTILLLTFAIVAISLFLLGLLALGAFG